MKSERHAAIRTIARLSAFAAKQRGRKSAPIEKQDCLFAFCHPSRNRAPQSFRKNRSALASWFLPQIDHANQRHLAIVDALGQGRELVLFREGVVIALELRRR